MATNYEILMSLSRKQMSSFIRSLVTKEASRYIDWASWLNSEDPEPSYIGTPAFTKDGDGERECYLLEETDDNGKIVRTIYTLLEKGEVRKETLPVHLVRKADEEEYQPAPLPEISEEAIDEAVIAQEEIVEELLSEAEAENTIPEMTIDEIISEPAPGEASKKIEDMIAQEVQEPEPAMDEDADISDKITAALIESEGIVDEHIDLEATTELPVFSQEVLNEINGEQEEEPAVLQEELNFDDIERALREEDDSMMETAELSVITEDAAAAETAGLSDDLIDELLLLEAAQFMDDDYFAAEKNAVKELPSEEEILTEASVEEPAAEEIQAEEIPEDIQEESEETPAAEETEEVPAEEETEAQAEEIQEETAEEEPEAEAEVTAEEIQEEEAAEIPVTEEKTAEEAETEAELSEEETPAEAEGETEETPAEEAETEEETETQETEEEPGETIADEPVAEQAEEETAEEADRMIVDEIELPEEILAEIGAAEAVLSTPVQQMEAEPAQAEEPAEKTAETAEEEPGESIQLFDDEDDELPDIILDLEEPKLQEKEEEKEWNIDELFDDDLMKELDDAVDAAEQAESKMTSSLKFDEPEQKEPVKEETGEEDDDVYFFSKGRIELLKEQLFDEDEPPAGKDELLFKETTAIEFVADKDGNEIRSGRDDISINELPQSKTADQEESQKIASFFDSVNRKEPIDKQEEIPEEIQVEAEPEKEPEENEVEYVFEDPRSAELQRFLEDVKHRSMLFDPDDPEDLELPTIAFSAMADEKENYF